jgi:hypothetical protein
VDLNRRIGEFEDPAWITESLQLGGGRVDFALLMGAVGLGLVIAQHAPLLLLLAVCTSGLAWSSSGRAQLATRSWLLELAHDWARSESTEPGEANLREAADVVRDRYQRGPSRVAPGQSRWVAELNERTPAHSEERDALIRKTQIAIKRERLAIELALHDLAVMESNQASRLH